MRATLTSTRTSALTSALVALVALSGAGCDEPADASVLVDLGTFANNLPGLQKAEATLDVVDADTGEALPVEVTNDAGERVLVQSPLPVPCDELGLCSLEVRVRPATVRFALHVTALDRCDARGELVRLDSEAIELKPHTPEFVDLTNATFAFDDDQDAIPNVFEVATCGRFDVEDGAAPPQDCARGEGDPCCAGVSTLEGRLTAFTGGAHLRADGTTATVEPFALDATEVTWRQLSRCVVAGACLANQPEHPVRAALAAISNGTQPVSLGEPVVGLNPAEAEALCAFFGKRLPRDDEWDFAAAHRSDPAVRGRYPWDNDDAPVTCDAEAGGVAANFSIPGNASCAGVPKPVDSFASSYANDDGQRGAGPALADMGGNVAEWTLVAGNAPAVNEVPEGHSAVVLRGGGALSPLSLLENDLPVRAVFPSSGDVDAWRDTILRLATTAGVRCAVDVDDGTVAPELAAEPACGAP